MTIPSASNEASEFAGGKTVVHSFQKHKEPIILPKIDIFDIRHEGVEINLRDEIFDSLKPETGPKTMPTLLLYDERGLQLFEEVSALARR